MDRQAVVLGGGAVARALAHLLAGRGWVVERRGPPARAVPALLLGETTVALLRDAWGGDDVDRLLRDAHRLRGREVHWGSDPITAIEPGLVVDGAALIAALSDHSPAQQGMTPAWTVHADGRSAAPLSASGVVRRFGTRVVVGADVQIPSTAADRAVLEVVPDGWLMLIPRAPQRAMLQAMLASAPPDADDALAVAVATSRAVASRLLGDPGPARAFAAAPTLHSPLALPGRIAVGDAAAAFDPLCGDGTGQGLRGALLAAAVLDAIAAGRPAAAALGHYQHRVQLALLRHLAHCLRFYESAPLGPTWQPEIAAMRAELSHPVNVRIARSSFRFALSGDHLVPLEPIRLQAE